MILLNGIPVFISSPIQYVVCYATTLYNFRLALTFLFSYNQRKRKILCAVTFCGHFSVML